MNKKTFKNSYFSVDVTETHEKGIGNLATIKLDMDFTMRYPNDDKKRINTNRTSWENEAFGLSDFEKAFNKSFIFNAYCLDKAGLYMMKTVDLMDCLLNYKQILALGICYNIHKVDDHGVPFFNKEFVRDEYDFGVGIPFLSLQDQLCLLGTADDLAREIEILKVEGVENNFAPTTVRVYINNILDCIEIKRVYADGYKFGMQVTWYETDKSWQDVEYSTIKIVKK